MAQVAIPFSSPDTEPSTEAVRAVLEERGTCRLSELREELDIDGLGEPLLELAEAGEVAVFPVGETVQVKPVS